MVLGNPVTGSKLVGCATAQSLVVPGTSNIHEGYTLGKVQTVRPETRQILLLLTEDSEVLSRLLKQSLEQTATPTIDNIKVKVKLKTVKIVIRNAKLNTDIY